jgi:uridine phosphorylase
MPSRLRPTASVAADAILVGDPGRSLLLAQELLEKPKMSNHARGLWGYSGRTASGLELTIQATGMGGPSAAVVLADLAKLGVRRAVRVGTCSGFVGLAKLGELLLVSEAIAVAGSAASFGLASGASLSPDRVLFERLEGELTGEARTAQVASFDTLLAASHSAPSPVAAADMQTVAVLSRGEELGIAVAAVLIVSKLDDEALDDESLERASIRAGRAAALALSNPEVEG